jgi:hypothetical protein
MGEEFIKGCPGCGFLGSIEADRREKEDTGFVILENHESTVRRANRQPAPPWIYTLVAIILGAMFIVMVYVYFKL